MSDDSKPTKDPIRTAIWIAFVVGLVIIIGKATFDRGPTIRNVRNSDTSPQRSVESAPSPESETKPQIEAPKRRDPTMKERYPGPWQEEFNVPITKALAKNNV